MGELASSRIVFGSWAFSYNVMVRLREAIAALMRFMSTSDPFKWWNTAWSMFFALFNDTLGGSKCLRRESKGTATQHVKQIAIDKRVETQMLQACMTPASSC